MSKVFLNRAIAALDDIDDIGNINAGALFDTVDSVERKKIEIKGKTFVFTGPAIAGGRKEIESVVIENGGIVKDNITRDVDYLVTDTPNSGSSKNKKADELKITKITSLDLVQSPEYLTQDAKKQMILEATNVIKNIYLNN